MVVSKSDLVPMSTRCATDGHGVGVVLVHPEIPPNTGNIGRLCAATKATLNLIEPLGFSLEDRYLRRAGLDYWPYLHMKVHSSWTEYVAMHPEVERIYFSARAEVPYTKAPFAEVGEVDLVFGCETSGLPAQIRAGAEDRIYRLPIAEPAVRSLNLANAVSVALYETLRCRGQF